MTSIGRSGGDGQPESIGFVNDNWTGHSEKLTKTRGKPRRSGRGRIAQARQARPLWCSLLLEVLPNYADGCAPPQQNGQVRGRPKSALPVFLRRVRPLQSQYLMGSFLEAIHQRRDRQLWRVSHQQVEAVPLAIPLQ